MLCTVYPLRYRGKRLTESELRAACAVGALSVHNYAGTSAHLVDQNFHSPLGALHDARALWLTERGYSVSVASVAVASAPSVSSSMAVVKPCPASRLWVQLLTSQRAASICGLPQPVTVAGLWGAMSGRA